MTIDINKLKAAALAATQGGWKLAKPQPSAYFDGYINPVSGGEFVELQVGINSSYGLLVWKMEDDEVSPKCQANATHIATANPSAVLELIARLEAADEEIESLRAQVAELKAMSACEAAATIPAVGEYVAQLETERDELKTENERVWAHNSALQVLNENVITERDELKAKLAGAIEVRDWWIQEQANQVIRTNEEIDIGTELTRQLAEYKADAARYRNIKPILDEFPEINPSNYDDADVCKLNAWGIELVLSSPCCEDKGSDPK